MEKEMSLEEMEWLSKRLGRFTSSELHKLFVSGRGKNPELFGDGAKTYIISKLAERLAMESKEQTDFKQAAWGKEHEGEAKKLFEKRTGLTGIYYGVENPQFFEYGDYAGGSPDWTNDDTVADFKCPYNSSEHVKNLLLSSASDLENAHYDYYCQGQSLMLFLNKKRFMFGSYDPRMVETKYRLKVLTIYPDEAWVNEFKERLEAAIQMLNDMEVKLSGAVLYSYDKEISTTLIQSA